MKHLFQNALVLAVGVALVGCEWGGGGGGDNSWNDSTSIANFSGSYRGASGYLVSKYSSASSSAGSSGSSGTTNSSDEFVSESQGSYAGTLVKIFTGNLHSAPITPGTVTLSFSGPGGSAGSFHADSSGSFSGSYTAMSVSRVYEGSGFVDHSTGAWRLQLSGSGSFSESIDITATYRKIIGGSSTVTTPTPTSTTGGGSGASGGISIFSFNVQQTGNKISIVDNNGSVYSGSFGDVKTTGNLSSSSTGSGFVNGDQVIAPFSAAGKSAAGVYVNLTGSFQGTVAGVTTVSETSGSTVTRKTSFALSNRVINGTWIEDGGKTGDIKGVSGSSSSITVSSGTSTNSP